jgi:ABC-type bacteriocin/lantibiotic exporter with double-glycine peptidase domain
MKMPLYYQETSWTCGAASLRMTLETLGIRKSEKQVVKLLKTNKIRGSYHKNFPAVADYFKLNHITMRNAKINDLKKLIREGWIIIINHFDPKNKVDHYVVVTKVDNKDVYFNDPWYKKDRNEKISYKRFNSIWHDIEKERGWLFAIKN